MDGQGVGVAGITTAQAMGLGYDAFITLLTTQLRNQNPLTPLRSEEFVAQLAEFSTIEVLLRQEEQFNQLVIVSFLGRTVEFVAEGVTAPLQGVVTAVKYENTHPKLVVSGEGWTKEIDFRDVTRVLI
jgi:flagellar basal-body rod modification protein FlgD